MKTTPARALLKDLTDRKFLSLEKGKLVVRNLTGEAFPLSELCELTPAQVQDGEEIIDPLHDVRKRAKDLIAGGVSREALAELFAELAKEDAEQTSLGFSLELGETGAKEGEIENAGTGADDTTLLQGETNGNPIHSNGIEGEIADSLTEGSGENGETPHVGEGVNSDDKQRLPRRGSRVSGG